MNNLSFQNNLYFIKLNQNNNFKTKNKIESFYEINIKTQKLN